MFKGINPKMVIKSWNQENELTPCSDSGTYTLPLELLEPKTNGCLEGWVS